MYHIIINPASRSGKGIKLWTQQIVPKLHNAKIPFRAYFSKQVGDVAQLVREICETIKRESETNATSPEDTVLIILGGDGTMNEALQGLDLTLPITLGYIPTGSSNDFARDLGIPKDPAAALELILNGGKVTSMDIGTITYPNGENRHFAVSCGIGYDAAVCAESLRSRIKGLCNKIGLGKLTYLGIALKQLFATKAVSGTLTLDDNDPIPIGKMLFTTGMIHRYEGGGFMFCPNAVADDGLFDLCVAGDLPKLLILFALPTAFYGKHYMFKGISGYRAAKIKIETPVPLWVHTDGEVGHQTTSLTITCKSKAIRVITP
ncbi:MAG: diacylglycerol kinase family lipid kinase [Lachnospiraceae bacterium]|nr:diacylglycerol kinase family lipid kinase [Lachnospiraceae bacterium]